MDANELHASYQARRDQAMQRLQALAVARNKYMMEQQQKAEAIRAKAIHDEQAARSESNKNWLNMAGTGAAIGANTGPWGALIGAGVGAVAGIAGSVSERHHKGDGFMDTLRHTGDAVIHPAGEKWNGMSDVPLGGMVAGGVMAGKAAGLGAPSTDAQAQPYQGTMHGLGYNGAPTAGPPTAEEVAAMQYETGSAGMYAPPTPTNYNQASNNQIASYYANPEFGTQYKSRLQ